MLGTPQTPPVGSETSVGEATAARVGYSSDDGGSNGAWASVGLSIAALALFWLLFLDYAFVAAALFFGVRGLRGRKRLIAAAGLLLAIGAAVFETYWILRAGSQSALPGPYGPRSTP